MKACKNCVHAVTDETVENGFTCKRFPPKPLMVPYRNQMTQEAGMMVQSFWPTVNGDDLCGEFSSNFSKVGH